MDKLKTPFAVSFLVLENILKISSEFWTADQKSIILKLLRSYSYLAKMEEKGANLIELLNTCNLVSLKPKGMLFEETEHLFVLTGQLTLFSNADLVMKPQLNPTKPEKGPSSLLKLGFGGPSSKLISVKAKLAKTTQELMHLQKAGEAVKLLESDVNEYYFDLKKYKQDQSHSPGVHFFRQVFNTVSKVTDVEDFKQSHALFSKLKKKEFQFWKKMEAGESFKNINKEKEKPFMIVAEKYSILLSIRREEYTRLKKRLHRDVKGIDLLNIRGCLPFLTQSFLKKIFPRLRKIEKVQGEVLYAPGQEASRFFILECGAIVV